MVYLEERNRMIYDVHKAYPDWSCEKIADLTGISRQRVHQIVQAYDKHGIMRTDMKNNNGNQPRLDPNIPVSAIKISKDYKIPISTIVTWVERKLVKVVNDPGQTGPGKFILLDPISLQVRIDLYKPRKKQETASII